MDSGNINGKITECIKDFGKKIKWMEKDHLNGLMEEHIKVNIFKIKKKVMDNLHGRIIGNIKESGKAENSMDLACLYQKMVNINMLNGIRESINLL